MDNEARKFLGTGWNFPFKVNNRGGIAVSEDELLVQQSIIQILLTAFGERTMRRDFGSGLKDLPFEPNDDLLERLVESTVIDSLRRWERRIDILNVTVLQDERTPERADILLSYKIVNENRVGNLVIPFFLTGETVPVLG